ncbi:MAG: tetratricopeptide repeat protein [Oscillospiraceae bacterium]|jgi:tetratricopeptide (TPR) repeat protein|nr:tetratricopeptide repeat protein [Oscillospiraceae bacterium]
MHEMNIRENPNVNVGRYFFYRATYFCKLGKYEEALNDFTESINVSPNNYSRVMYAHAIRGGILIEQKLYERAMIEFTKALKIAPYIDFEHFSLKNKLLSIWDVKRMTARCKNAIKKCERILNYCKAKPLK